MIYLVAVYIYFSHDFLSFSNDQSNAKVTNMKQFVNVVVLSDHGQLENSNFVIDVQCTYIL